MHLCTNAGIVSDALKFVTQKQKQINTLQQPPQQTESIITETETEQAIEEEETTTTNGVF
jgi:hypothetical protein